MVMGYPVAMSGQEDAVKRDMEMDEVVYRRRESMDALVPA
jgi:hypothetical protein